MKFVVGCDQAFNILQQRLFRELILIARPDAKLIGDKTAKKRVHSAVNSILQKTVSQIGNSRFSVSCDAWTAPGMTASYMAVVVHYIDAQWKYHERLVGFERLIGRHSGTNMSISLNSVFMNSSPPFIPSNVLVLTTDGASNNATMAEAMTQDWVKFQPERQHWHCFAHILNLLAQVFWHVVKKTADDGEIDPRDIPDEELIDELDSAAVEEAREEGLLY